MTAPQSGRTLMHNQHIRDEVSGMVAARREELLATRRLQADTGYPTSCPTAAIPSCPTDGSWCKTTSPSSSLNKLLTDRGRRLARPTKSARLRVPGRL